MPAPAATLAPTGASAAAGPRDWPHRMLVGTFHKTGTILFRTILRRLSDEFGLTLFVRGPSPAPPHWHLCFDPMSVFPPGLRDGPHRGVVVIRDPRDVIISGAFYHQRLETGQGDAWALLPDARFGGRSYRQRINAFATQEERFLFEMHHVGTRTIRHMLRYAPPPAPFVTLRFETLVTDRSLAEFARGFDWLGLPPGIARRALEIAHDESLFSGRVTGSHVRSGRPEQWRRHFTPALTEAFRRRFGDAAERLGYPAA